MWKAVETKARKIRVTKAKGRKEKRKSKLKKEKTIEVKRVIEKWEI